MAMFAETLKAVAISKSTVKTTGAKRVSDSDGEDEVRRLRARLSSYAEQAQEPPGQRTLPVSSYVNVLLRQILTVTNHDTESGVVPACDVSVSGASQLLHTVVSRSSKDVDSTTLTLVNVQPPASEGVQHGTDDCLDKPNVEVAAASRKSSAAGGSRKRSKQSMVTDLTSDDEGIDLEAALKAPQRKVRKIQSSPSNREYASVSENTANPAAKLPLDSEIQSQSVALSRPKRTATRAPVVVDLDDSDDDGSEVETSSEDADFHSGN